MLYRLILTFFILCTCVPPLWAATVSVSSQYPSPNGQHKSLQLNPGAAPFACSITTIGSFYADTNGQIFSCINNSGAYTWIAANPWTLNTATNDLYPSASSSNVGIGTLSPTGSAKLTITQTDANEGLTIANSGGTPRFKITGMSNGSWNILENASGSWLSPLSQSSGNVGIGTAVSTSKLSVTGEGTGKAQLGITCGGNYVGLTLGQTSAPTCNNYNLTSSPTDLNLYVNRPTGSAIRFKADNGTSDQMTILPGGNVGINSTSPNSKLTVKGSFGTTGQLVLQANTAGTSSGIISANAAGTQTNTITVDNNGFNYNNTSGGASATTYEWLINAGARAMVIERTSGNIGIGITSPVYKLNVAGDIYANGPMRFNTRYSYSDGKLKDDVSPITDAVGKIQQLKPVKFSWKKNGKKDIGMIAQEVETVFPQLVFTNEKGIKSVAYSNLVAVLIEAVKEQQNEIDALKAQIQLIKDKRP